MRSFETTVETGEELAAVNDMLASIGESPVSTLEGDQNADVSNARRILNRVNRQIQSKGWTFNIEENVTLSPDVFSGLIPYLAEYLLILAPSGATPYVNRGNYVYDRINRTDEFSSPITVNIVRLKEYHEMPECFRSWIVAKASRQFNNFFFGAPEIEQALAEQEQEARMQCQEFEVDYGNYNMLTGDAFTGGLLTR